MKPRPNFDQMNEIFESMHNGQFRQAYNQMAAMGLEHMPELMDYIEQDLNRPQLAMLAAKCVFRNRY